MKIIRWILGGIILFINRLTQPARGSRDAEKQQAVELALADYSLYQFQACPFCVKARRELVRLNLPITLRDAKASPWREELLQEGGKVQVPCLRIQHSDERVEWLYESDDIIAFLQRQFPL